MKLYRHRARKWTLLEIAAFSIKFSSAVTLVNLCKNIWHDSLFMFAGPQNQNITTKVNNCNTSDTNISAQEIPLDMKCEEEPVKIEPDSVDIEPESVKIEPESVDMEPDSVNIEPCSVKVEAGLGTCEDHSLAASQILDIDTPVL